MKIAYILDSTQPYLSGIWWHRIETPARALGKRGHAVRQVLPGAKNEGIIEWADVAVFGRTYHPNLKPLELLRDFKKAGKRVVYDMDDDFWQVAKDNPSILVSNAFKDQYEAFVREADVLITPSKVLAKKFKKLSKKPVYICPNAANPDFYKERPHQRDELVIGYMGAASHWKDLQLITKPLTELYKKYNFSFDIYGLTGEPIEAAMYYHQKNLEANVAPEKNEYFKSALEFYDGMLELRGRHTPFMPPELHPGILSRCDFDIGLAPLQQNEFNRGKSDIKFLEYATVGTVTLASDVEPYTDSGVQYFTKPKDWYKKLEKLITDKDFRENLLKKQKDWIDKNRSMEVVGLAWELALQKQSGLNVLNQEIPKWLKF